MNIKVGFGRCDITPKVSVPMAGYGNNHMRMHQNVLDPIYASCTAITDEQENTLLLFTMDLCWVLHGIYELWQNLPPINIDDSPMKTLLGGKT